ncbi:hypothetical protein F5883DRAFT_180478 [Diaporthe sp. PMI_573]|nr:hypothetical protein F5883DRAFT_180478 [Diaporthaceae sp. PMI_573]
MSPVSAEEELGLEFSDEANLAFSQSHSSSSLLHTDTTGPRPLVPASPLRPELWIDSALTDVWTDISITQSSPLFSEFLNLPAVSTLGEPIIPLHSQPSLTSTVLLHHNTPSHYQFFEPPLCISGPGGGEPGLELDISQREITVQVHEEMSRSTETDEAQSERVRSKTAKHVERVFARFREDKKKSKKRGQADEMFEVQTVTYEVRKCLP